MSRLRSPRDGRSGCSRRGFLRQAGALGGGALLLGAAGRAAEHDQPLPRRLLGRTRLEVSVLSLGTWPAGKCDAIDVQGVARLVGAAIDRGLNHIDAARAYDDAEAGIALAVKGKRDGLVLTTKVWADTAEQARRSFEQSLKILGVDYVDILYLHSAGDRDIQRVMGKGGALEYLLRQKEAGKARFVGMSGHCRPGAFLPLIETGQFDVVLCAMNFVDRHTYGFEDKVLPAALKQNMGVCCMKVFGGMKGGFGVADGPDTGPEIDVRYLQQAVNYSLGLPGVATLVIGMHTVEQLERNVEAVKRFQPLSERQQKALDRLGREMAQRLGPHLGPVA